MRYLILSDIHANNVALEAVLAAVRSRHYHRTIVLGDLVGYGTGCNECIDAIRNLKKKKLVVRGNHDKVACGLENGAYFNITALASISWTRKTLTEENRSFLQRLPRGPLSVHEDLLVCHGSPADEDEYIFTDYDAFRVFSATGARLILHGHTHIPVIFTLNEQGVSLKVVRDTSFRLKMDPHARYLINPGSVGQPRDRISSASYAILDDKRNTLFIERVPYDVGVMQRSILDAGLPASLAERLAQGT